MVDVPLPPLDFRFESLEEGVCGSDSPDRVGEAACEMPLVYLAWAHLLSDSEDYAPSTVPDARDSEGCQAGEQPGSMADFQVAVEAGMSEDDMPIAKVLGLEAEAPPVRVGRPQVKMKEHIGVAAMEPEKKKQKNKEKDSLEEKALLDVGIAAWIWPVLCFRPGANPSEAADTWNRSWNELSGEVLVLKAGS